MSAEPTRLDLSTNVVEAMRAALPASAERVVAAVVREVPTYSAPFMGRMGRNIETAVAMALDGFLDMTVTTDETLRNDPVQPVFDAAYALGRGEARSGRSMDALAAAYRVGARTAWHDLSVTAVENDLAAGDVARFAELVFDYIDQLSAMSVSGHADELASSGRVRERHLERLATSILNGAAPDTLLTLAERAGWEPPTTLTAVIVAETALSGVRHHLDVRSLFTGADGQDLDNRPDLTVVLAADLTSSARGRLVEALRDREAMVGSPAPWLEAQTSWARTTRCMSLGLAAAGESADSDDHLMRLIQSSDPSTLADLRSRVLAPMEGLRPSTVEKLQETLRAWLLHQGRRDEIAEALFVHPQTVRYRLGQLREAYGDRLNDPQFVLEATLALG